MSTASLLLRLYSRWFKTRRLWSDDAYAIIAVVIRSPIENEYMTDNVQFLLATVSITILRMSITGFGLHYWNVPTANAVELLKLF